MPVFGLKRYDPFQEVLSLHDAMNQLFAQSFVQPGWSSTGSQTLTAPINVFETDSGYQVHVLLPGMNPEDIELTVQQNSLTIKGQFHPHVEQEKNVKWLAQEFGPGSFERTITFPKPFYSDEITTSYENGVLSLWLPISESSRPKKISITSGQPQRMTVEAGSNHSNNH